MFYQNWLKPITADIVHFVTDTLFPSRCVICLRLGNSVCISCILALPTRLEQRCIVCAKKSLAGITHANCHSPWRADGLLTYFSYQQSSIARALIYGKYYYIESIFPALTRTAVPRIQQTLGSLLPDLEIVPIPLAASRRRWRGFNQAEVIANTIGDELQLPVLHALVRTRYTKVQKNLKGDARKKNVANCFALNPGTDVHGKSILIVDDVTTTGSTLSEAAEVLKRNGARSVWCFALAQD